jgi:cytochrome c553
MKNMKICFIASVTACLLTIPGTILAKGDPAKGQEKALSCEACHGKTGISIDPNYPNLAGQHYSYLVKALSDYRSGDRSNAIMASFAANLSNQDIEDLAAWFASQKGLEDLSVN